MLRAALFFIAMAILGQTQAWSLEMRVVTNEEEKLVYLHLWGPIVNGDDEKFRSVILPYIQKGYLPF
jgi:hypothetical protein